MIDNKKEIDQIDKKIGIYEAMITKMKIECKKVREEINIAKALRKFLVKDRLDEGLKKKFMSNMED